MQIVYPSVNCSINDANILGGKGKSLVDMVKLGLPVPPAAIIRSGACNFFLTNRRPYVHLMKQLATHLKDIELLSGQEFGNPENPLLVSVRSCAKESMPGMMDTVLNVGLTLETYHGFVNRVGEQCADSCLNQLNSCDPSFYRQQASSQLINSIVKVWNSWNSSRAIDYRNYNNITSSDGTAVIIQTMVFGNGKPFSGTGVVFSRDITTGEPGLWGEFLPNAQGEDLVSGKNTPQPIAEFEEIDSKIYNQLKNIVTSLEDYYGDIVDVEFTIEENQLYILQVRNAKKSPKATRRFFIDRVEEGKLEQDEAIKQAPHPKSLLKVKEDHPYVTCLSGIAAAPGVVSSSDEKIWVSETTSPEHFEGMRNSVAIVTANGGATCHAAIVARSLGIPSVVGLGITDYKKLANYRSFNSQEYLTVDGTNGHVYLGDVPLEETELDSYDKKFLTWINNYKSRFNNNAIPNFEGGSYLDWGFATRLISINLLASDFYLMEAGAFLNFDLIPLRTKIRTNAAAALSQYLVSSIGGELRHSWSESWSYGDGDEKRVLAEEELADLGDYGIVRDQKRNSALKAVVSHFINLEIPAVVEFLDYAYDLFENRSWSSGYGGKKWALIVLAVRKYLDEEITNVEFVDLAFDLQHNGGSAFDKSSFVTCDRELLRRQLDIKRDCAPIELYPKLNDLHAPVSLEVKEALIEAINV